MQERVLRFIMGDPGMRRDDRPFLRKEGRYGLPAAAYIFPPLSNK